VIEVEVERQVEVTGKFKEEFQGKSQKKKWFFRSLSNIWVWQRTRLLGHSFSSNRKKKSFPNANKRHPIQRHEGKYCIEKFER
jgi:hypothetical protein